MLKCNYDKDFSTLMDANSSTVARFKAQVNKFSGILSKKLPKTKQRLFREMLYGIQASKDIKLSNIGRALQEPIALIKTEDRLSRNMDDMDYSDHINSEVLRLAKRHVTDNMVIAIDPGDVCKPYAKEMEHLCNIYDGDRKTPAQGYHLIQVTAANLEHNKVVPLHCELYSTADGQVRNNAEKIKEVIVKVKEVIGKSGVWAIDREGDSKEIINHFLENELTFVTRLKERDLQFDGNLMRVVSSKRLHKHVTKKYKSKLVCIRDGRESEQMLTYSTTTVAIPDMPGVWFNAVIIEGWGEVPMVLLTNLKVDPANPLTLVRVMECYLTRWKCEECYRYIKQSYNTEDVRVRSYNGLRNTIGFIHAIAYFTSIYMGISLKLKIMVEKIYVLSKRFFGIPNFFNYAMADGIYNLLKLARTGPTPVTTESIPQFQLRLLPDS